MDRLRNFGFLMKDISRLQSKNFERHASGLNMTLAQCKVLAHLERNEGIAQVRLAELADTDPMTLVRILDRMERDGWVERRADPVDRRARQLFLTKAATPVLEEMWRVADRARAEALAGLSAADREQLLSLLGRIQSNLQALLPAIQPAESASGEGKPVSVERVSPERARKGRASAKSRAGKSAESSRPARRESKVSR
jgi:MarR family transcriptional regulator, transcriptional regulator for hemolysin